MATVSGSRTGLRWTTKEKTFALEKAALGWTTEQIHAKIPKRTVDSISCLVSRETQAKLKKQQLEAQLAIDAPNFPKKRKANASKQTDKSK